MTDGLYDHSQNAPRIANPMRFLGAMQALRGVILTVLAALILLKVSPFLAIQTWLGLTATIIGFGLMGVGIFDIAMGLRHSFRLFIGRTLPISLARNLADSSVTDQSFEKPYLAYGAQILHEQLKKGVNSSFQEPQGWMASLIASLYPAYIVHPRPVRGVILGVFTALAKTLLSMIILAIVWFVCTAGLVGDAAGFVQNGAIIAAVAYLSFVWRRIGFDDRLSSTRSIAITLGLSLVLPVALSLVYAAFSRPIQNDPAFAHGLTSGFDAQMYSGVMLIGIVIFAAVATVLAMQMLASRDKSPCRVKVTERVENTQQNFHPQDLINNMDALVWNDYREESVPNRVYHNSNKIDWQSEQEGKFEYGQILESQPQVVPVEASGQYRLLRIISAVLYTILGVAGAVMLYQGMQFVAEITDEIIFISHQRISDYEAATYIGNFGFGVLNWVLLAWLTFSLSSAMRKILLPFVAEVRWQSRLISFEMNGTATRTHQRSGNKITDTHQTENIITRCSMTAWLWCAKIQSTSFVNLYGRGLRSPRTILDITEDGSSAQQVLNNIQQFLGSRSNTVSLAQNEKDLEAAQQMSALNQSAEAPAVAGTLAAGAVLLDNAQDSELSTEPTATAE
ncbi:hypothetical protein VST7929_00068 [Vibrio stylophorae]|uniref:Uncharacterized protein n=1 Tax=Vibrio stylophorae TaxID=659351 RepID=A0ABN8DQJ9_9VIBR|nr:hypothetical protein [Vibrio stylophorae]CAH0532256.1 hypothetical protein VST7929_00068 [Vibrio stylophorae]